MEPADSFRSAGEDQITGKKLPVSGYLYDEAVDRENHLRGVAGLAEFLIDITGETEMLQVVLCRVERSQFSQRGAVVECFAAFPRLVMAQEKLLKSPVRQIEADAESAGERGSVSRASAFPALQISTTSSVS